MVDQRFVVVMISFQSSLNSLRLIASSSASSLSVNAACP